ncbi:MAG: hypothetical protein HFE85_03185 [Clostridiales bacterium]|nr:hypothetical protein [Clostridiales bacterium]
MIKISDIRLPLDGGRETLLKSAAKRLGVPARDIVSLRLVRRSVDARKKDQVHFNCAVEAALKGGAAQEAAVLQKRPAKAAQAKKTAYLMPPVNRKPSLRPVIAGAGPAGLFAALTLCEAGLRPILLERGADVDTRIRDVERMRSKGMLDERSNVQFGEGGAGTFSDGKLTTGISDPRCRRVLEAFVQAGAPEEILWQAKPHIGTDRLIEVVRNLRGSILAKGGEVRFLTRLTDIVIKEGRIAAVRLAGPGGEEELETEALILAVGHSARDTFQMLYERGAQMIQKPFSVGVRIEHPQRLIDRAQYGNFAGHPALGAADYKLSAHLTNGRGVYTFCMCPGGEVVAAASEPDGVVTNGMSRYARDGQNANSALLVGVDGRDFGSVHPLAGVEFQRKLERCAFFLGGENYRAPAQLVGDFLAGQASSRLGTVQPSYRPGVTLCDLTELFPEEIGESLKMGIRAFDRRLHGFALPDAVMTGVESRSSSPVRIVRDERCEASIHGIYPCGEGAGYAGGIMSAAVDGIRCAEAVFA